MEKKRYEGVWRIPGVKGKLCGTLEMKEGGYVRLRTIGTFFEEGNDIWYNKSGRGASIAIINGFTTCGKKVTLLNNSAHIMTAIPGITGNEISCSEVFFWGAI